MNPQITLFSGYSQSENRTTNYCLLILKMLYEENPKFLAEVLSTLVGEELGEKIGVRFRQQEKKTASIPDGLILQDAFTIYIETKNFDWFYDDQLEKHLTALDQETPGFKMLIALSSFETDEEDRFKNIRALCDEKYKKSLAFEPVTFEELAQALSGIALLPKNLADAVKDFRSYLDEKDLLPSWQRRLDVVNCVKSSQQILEANIYWCPATGASYNHSRCKFFGMYQKKRVEKIALIEAVVDLEDEQKASVKWRNVSGPKPQFVARARAKLQQVRPGKYPMRVFLLGPFCDTEFQKDSPGGMYGSKQYFDVDQLNAKDAQTLASALRGKLWSEFRDQDTGA